MKFLPQRMKTYPLDICCNFYVICWSNVLLLSVTVLNKSRLLLTEPLKYYGTVLTIKNI
jgi:hypothetical protein